MRAPPKKQTNVLFLLASREWQMERAFQTALWLLQPEVVFILGDIFDEGKWSSSQVGPCDTGILILLSGSSTGNPDNP